MQIASSARVPKGQSGEFVHLPKGPFRAHFETQNHEKINSETTFKQNRFWTLFFVDFECPRGLKIDEKLCVLHCLFDVAHFCALYGKS